MFIQSILSALNSNIMQLNNSKLFAGIIMILLNVGSKFIQIQFSKSTETYMKNTLSKQILVFSMAWLGTRDIYTAIIITVIFTIISEYLFNEECPWCIVPHKYRVLPSLEKEQQTAEQLLTERVTDDELAAALLTISKARDQRRKEQQLVAFEHFDKTKTIDSPPPAATAWWY